MEYQVARHIYLKDLASKIEQNHRKIFPDAGYNKETINIICSDQDIAANCLPERFEFIDFLNAMGYPRSISEPLLKSYVEDDYMDVFWQMLSPKEFLTERRIAFMKSPKGRILRYLNEF